ncbi:MAG: hypothetical protein JSV45_07935 [Chromatiales bacterium]|nr:MAG: hypothetical protein JSV45_07935 [Chromatiales bacterium]
MRRVVIIALLALGALLLWRTQLPGLKLGNSPVAGQGSAAGAVSAGTGAADELRIEIVETATEAEARHQAIIAQYGDDPVAQAWVADCTAQSAAGQDGDQFTASWDYGCWRSWADEQESVTR